MSHFTVLVIGDNIEEQLLSFHEFECTGLDNEYVVAKIDEEFSPEIIEKIREDYRRWAIKEPDDFAGKADLPATELVCDYHDYDVVIEERDMPALEDITADNAPHKYSWLVTRDGMPVYSVRRTNPNAKWDWYQIGGRWTGAFRLKEGAEGELGNPGLFTEPAEPGWVDQARKGDIDIEGMRAEAEAEANRIFDIVEATIKGLPQIVSWKSIREKWEAITAAGDLPVGPETDPQTSGIDFAREEYRAQPVVQALRANEILRDWGGFFENLEDTFCLLDADPRAAYVAKRRCGAFSAWAVLYRGEWNEKGEMGWFGMATDEKSTYDWGAIFNDLIDSLPDDALLTMVDCHI